MFDNAIFRIFGDNKDLSGDATFNLILENKKQTITIKKIVELVNIFSSEYGSDRRGMSKWTDIDSKRVSTYWEGREWIVDATGKSFREYQDGCSQINLFFNPKEGIEFSILNANWHM